MSTAIAVNFRIYDLPWTPSAVDERRLRRIVGAALGLLIAFGIVIPLLPERPRDHAAAPPVPDRIVEFLIERPKPPPKPVPKVEPPPTPVTAPAVERPAPVKAPVVQSEPKPDPRKKAASAGLLALADQLQELRDLSVEDRPDARPLNAGSGNKARVDRALLTARTGEGSGGITVGQASHGFGGGATGLKGISTAQVSAGAEASADSGVQRAGKSSKAARTREEIELVFDRNKSAIYAIYSRALRDNPALQGKVVLEVTIAPSGEVTDCRIVSSDLGDADLEHKLVARVKMFRFEAKDVATMTTTKPIEFFPA
ncbi:MAG: AgmX/PglI C-terminal domain-containing protein [Steroidobacteraceae bacterium]